jgi:hypothetical protein
LHRTSTSPSSGSGLGALSSIAIFLGSTIWIALIGYLVIVLSELQVTLHYRTARTIICKVSHPVQKFVRANQRRIGMGKF